jgi:5'-3' exonuclease
MGIPSYFRHLLQRYPQLLKDVDDKTRGNILLVDFNCLIYGCAKSTKLPMYTHASRTEWEDMLLREIRSYVVHLWMLAGKPEEVVLAVDGVVPMAKIRQQRLRRFKGSWFAGKELELGARLPSREVWDTNCITPGTEFMDRLERTLKDLASTRGPRWLVSSANEPGEGEQKLMQWIREKDPKDLENKHIIVYGLDADLILLCIMHAGPESTWSILREKQEFIKSPLVVASNRPPCLLLSIKGLTEVMFPDMTCRAAHIRDYIAGMSLLGNDFIPHNAGIHIRDAGHDRLLAALDAVHSGGQTLLYEDQADGIWKWNRTALLLILGEWAATEKEDIEHTFQKKYKMRPQPPRSHAEQCMAPLENMPIDAAEELRLWSRRTGLLFPEWKSMYYMEKRGRSLTATEIQEKCVEYLRGLQWNIDYYTGQRAVSNEWMYPWTYAPLWSDLYATVASMDAGLPTLVTMVDERPLQPQEQLSLVLPLESWWLIRDSRLKAVPTKIPHFWPATFGFSTMGKRWLWECPAEIPILVPKRLFLVTNEGTVT